MRRIALSLCLLTGLATACSDAPGDTGTGIPNNGVKTDPDAGATDPGLTCAKGNLALECQPQMLVVNENGTIDNNGSVPISAGDLAPGQFHTENFSINNAGKAALGIASITLSYEAKSPDEATDPAFTCIADDKVSACNGFKFPGVAPGGPAVNFTIKFKKFPDDVTRTAKVVISTNDVKTKVFTIHLATSAGQARIQLQPPIIDFDFVQIGTSPSRNAKVLSVGNSPLHVESIDRSALDPSIFNILLTDDHNKAIAAPPFDIAPGTNIQVTVVYTAKDDKPHVGDIIFKTNDPSLTQDGGVGWRRLKVKVNSSGPCLKVSPTDVVFGATAVGAAPERPITLESCGDQQVCVTDMSFDTPPGPGSFTLVWKGVNGGVAPTKAAPLCIPINGKALLKAVYMPTQLSKKDGSGQPIPDKASVTVHSDSGSGDAKVTLQGVGANGDCPTGIITVAEGDTVTPQTVLHLDGKQSYSTSGGAIATYKWTVKQPEGSVSTFLPAANKSSVTFQPNVAGDYKFQLAVTDSSGKPSCFPAEKVVKVLPDQALHVELLWNTPGDKDQTNEGPDAGADMDLHFAHDFAAMPDYDKDGKADPWFSDAYDCFWFNCATSGGKALEWGSYDPNIDDNPHLDRDDTDGGGPENLNLTLPEDGKTYAVGVHYYKEHGFGASIATVRVYVYGDLTFEKTSAAMNQNDMWYAARITWPDGAVSAMKNPKDASLPFFITAKYPAPAL